MKVLPALAIGIAGLLWATGSVFAQTAPSEKVPPTGAVPAVIPIFPLEVTMLFPGVSRPLHIFEPRYRAMVADALKGDRIIGMVIRHATIGGGAPRLAAASSMR